MLEQFEKSSGVQALLLEHLLLGNGILEAGDDDVNLELVNRHLGHLRVDEAPDHGAIKFLTSLSSSLPHD